MDWKMLSGASMATGMEKSMTEVRFSSTKEIKSTRKSWKFENTQDSSCLKLTMLGSWLDMIDISKMEINFSIVGLIP